MIDTGLYQNQIDALDKLDIMNYERIFKVFEMSVNNKDFYTYNILKRVDFPEIDNEFIEFRDVLNNTPLTILSYKIYGDIKSWWILYLLNKDKFVGAPFIVDGGTQIKYIKNSFRTSIYQDINTATTYGGRHY